MSWGIKTDRAEIDGLVGVTVVKKRILHESSCFIEFIKRVEEKR